MHNYDKTFEHLRDEGVRVDVRRANPYVYTSSYERNEMQKIYLKDLKNYLNFIVSIGLFMR